MAIELEKQESLLAQIHEEMSVGTVAKHREEQLWEVTLLLSFSSFEFSMNFLSAQAQRIVTQLKRQLKQSAPATGPPSVVDGATIKCADSSSCEKASAVQTKEIEVERNCEELKLELALPDEPSPEISQPSKKSEPEGGVSCRESSVPCVEETRQESASAPENKINKKSETPAAITAIEICPKDHSEAQPTVGLTRADVSLIIEQDLELALMIENLEREKLIEQIAQAIEIERESVERLQELLAEKS